MDTPAFQQRILPHIIAVLVFLIVTVVFFFPAVFEGKVLRQNDIDQGAGSASEIVEYRENTGDEALWTNSMFGGMPAYLINLRWSGESIALTIQNVVSLFLGQSVREVFLSILCFYVMLLVFGVRPYLAIAGALAFGLNTFFIISLEAGHVWKVRAIAYMPLVLAGIHLTFRGKLLAGGILTALAMTLELLANHLQITYYLFLTVLIYGLVQLFTFIKEKKLLDFARITAVLVLAVLVAVSANFGRLWATYEYGKHSIRGASELTSIERSTDAGLDRDYAFHWSSGAWESFTFLVPHLYGGASGQFKGKSSELAKVLRQNNLPPQQIDQYQRGLLGYWGPQPGVAGPVYLGATICLLFVIGIFFADKKYKIWLITAAVLGIMLSWGKNFESFNYLMFDHFPGYNKFRSVTMTVVISILAMNLLGFIGLENVLKKGLSKEVQKKLLISLGIVGGLLVLIALFVSPPLFEGENIPRAVRDAVHSDRLSIVRTDVMRSLFFVVAVFAIVYFYLKQKLGATLFFLLFIAVVGLDIITVDRRYISSDNYVRPSRNDFYQPTEADKKIMQDDGIFRVLNLSNPFNEAQTSNFHFSIGGYHGAKMRRYSDVIDRQLQHEMKAITSEGALTPENTRMLSALNTRYLIAGTGENGAIRNPHALGNAWLVKEVKTVMSADEEIEAVGQVGLDTVAVVDESKFSLNGGQYDDSGAVQLTEYQPNKLVYSYNNPSDGFVVFSEVYYPDGWLAFIDGEPAEILRANYILRALEVPAGEHIIEFRFEPRAYFAGNTISYIGNIILLLSILAYFVVYFFSKKNEKGAV